jgi:hypothetical protein
MRTPVRILSALVVGGGLVFLTNPWNSAGDVWADETSRTVTATVLDVPAPAADGSIRFHALLDPAAGLPRTGPHAVTRRSADQDGAGRRSS